VNETILVETVLVALIFAMLLGLEWRYRLSSVRLATAVLSLAVFLFAQPDYTTAARRVSVAPQEERITELRGSPISEYESGVLTMYEAIDKAQEIRAKVRLLALGALFWLACSQVLRREQRVSTDASGPQPPGRQIGS
jgi:hypothetical protein